MQRVKLVVIAFEVEELVLDRVSENRVSIITTADQVNPVVIAFEVNILVLNLALENRVIIISTAHQANHVAALIKDVP